MRRENMTIKIIQRRGENIMGNIIVKICLLSLVLFIGKAPVFGQDPDIRCGVGSFESSSSGDPTVNELGIFSMLAEGKKVEESEGIELGEMLMANKFYGVPKTKLTLSVAVLYAPASTYGSAAALIVQMVLGKKKVLGLFTEKRKLTKDVVGFAQTVHSMEAFEKEGEGMLSMAFSEKEQPIQIIMRCKKED